MVIIFKPRKQDDPQDSIKSMIGSHASFFLLHLSSSNGIPFSNALDCASLTKKVIIRL